MTTARRRRKTPQPRRYSTFHIVVDHLCRGFRFLEYLIYPANNVIETTYYDVENGKIPQAFDGYVIAQVSDLHGKAFGKKNERLVSAVESALPDLIVVTGDVVDEKKFCIDHIAATLQGLAEIAPTFYVNGNHEAELPQEKKQKLLETLRDAGVVALLDDATRVTRGAKGESILLVGVRDPRFDVEFHAYMREKMAPFAGEHDDFRILLAHRPEGFPDYVVGGFDLVFSGHAHGGQFRIPGALPSGLYAPGQGWFPKYTFGKHAQGGTTLVVSRGLGSSVVPTRLFNRPELVVCTLRRIVENE